MESIHRGEGFDSSAIKWHVSRQAESLLATSSTGTVRLGDEMDANGQRVRRLEIVGMLYLHENQQRPFCLTCTIPFTATGLRDFAVGSYEPMANYAPAGERPIWRQLHGTYIQQTRLLAKAIVERLSSDLHVEREEALAILSQPFAGE